MLCLYVDDGFCDMDAHCPGGEADMRALASAFDIKVKEDTNYFLGTNVTEHSPHSLTLSARTYIGKLVEKYLPKPLAEYARVRMPADHALSEAYGAALERTDTLSGSDYPSKVGALIYGVPCGRIDVAYVVGILARCLTFPTATLSAAAERVLVYLGQHAGDGLTYDGTVPDADVLVGYSDSNWTVGHSTTGYTIEIANASVCYASKRQHCISLSSTEAEIIAASTAACEIVYLRGLLAEMGVPQPAPTVLYVDNQGAVELSKDAKSCHRSRHVLRRFFKVRELVHAGEVEVKWIDTASNKADLLTKSSFAPTTFEKLKSMVMAPKATNVVSFTGVPLHMLVPGDGAGASSDGDAAAPAAPPAVNPLLALAAATRAEALVAAEAAFERGTFDVAEARALAGAYGATHINAATNRAITAVLAHRAGNYRDNKSAFEDYKISSRTYYKWKAAIDNNQPFNL